MISIACGVSLDTGGEKTSAEAEVEQTLQAVYAQYTLEAMTAANANPPAAAELSPEASVEAPAPTEIPHTTIPGNPGSPDQKKDEIDTSNTAGQEDRAGRFFPPGQPGAAFHAWM